MRLRIVIREPFEGDEYCCKASVACKYIRLSSRSRARAYGVHACKCAHLSVSYATTLACWRYSNRRYAFQLNDCPYELIIAEKLKL